MTKLEWHYDTPPLHRIALWLLRELLKDLAKEIRDLRHLR